MNTKLIATASAIAALMIAGSTVLAAPNAGAMGQSNPPPQQQNPSPLNKRNVRGPILEGRIASINGNAITLEPKNRRDTAGPIITVNESTTYYASGVSNATLASIKAGDRVAILIDKAASNNTTRIASAVSVLPLPESAVVAGVVSNVSASGFTLTGPRGNSGTVNAAGAKVIVPGNATAGLSDIQNGAHVAVQGKPGGNQNIDATLIVVVPQNRDNIFAGVIAAIDGNTLTLFTRDGQQIKVDVSSAVIFERGNTASTLADLKAGRAVAVIGIKNADGSVTAQLVGQANLPYFTQRK